MSSVFWRDKKVLVAGGAGFIGSNLSKELVDKGAKVRVADNLERGKLEDLRGVKKDIEFTKVDLSEKQNCLDACSGVDVVFQMAAKVGGIDYYLESPAEVLQENLLIDNFMLKAAIEEGVTNYLYPSSAHVYPTRLQTEPDAPPLEEGQAVPANPDLSYGWEKLMIERQLQYFVEQTRDFSVSIVRIFGAYGGNQDINLKTASAIPAFCRRAVEYPERKPFKVLSSGEETRSYCYISDVVRALTNSVEALDGSRIVGPLNIGTEGRISIESLAKKIIEISGKDIDIVFGDSSSTSIWGQAPDCRKARTEIAWKPNVSLDRGLKKTYSAIKSRLE